MRAGFKIFDSFDARTSSASGSSSESTFVFNISSRTDHASSLLINNVVKLGGYFATLTTMTLIFLSF